VRQAIADSTAPRHILATLDLGHHVVPRLSSSYVGIESSVPPEDLVSEALAH
jgi:hypothetical protein